MNKKQVVIALNGRLQGDIDDYRSIIKKGHSTFIAADGGAMLLEKLGVLPDVILGDFDSLTDNKLIYYKKKNIEVIKYPVEKDETDGELALRYCLENNLENIIIIGARGGRLDQQLANILLIEYAFYNGLEVLIKEPGLEIGLIVEEKKFNGCQGEGLSLIPLSRQVSGVNIKGCKYKLKDEQLFRYKTRGISNTIIEERAVVSLKEGSIIYIKQSS